MQLSEVERELATKLEADLLKLHGSPVLSGETLYKLLGYCSNEAFRQSLVRGTVPVVVFSIEGRRGKCALVSDVARWLAHQRYMAEPNIAPTEQAK